MKDRIPVLGLFFGVFLGAGTGYSAQELAGGASAALDGRTLRVLCLELLGRPPLPEEWERWLGRPRAEYLDSTIGSKAFWEHWYEEQLYYFLLINNFRPAQDRQIAIPADLAAQRCSVREALHRIALSSSFDLRNPGADTFVTVVLEQIAGLDITRSQRELEIGKRVYDGASGVFLGTQGASQADVVRNAVMSRSSVQHFLRREYERLLHVKPDAAALPVWIARLEKEPLAYGELLREWCTSPAFDARVARGETLENLAFVRALFVDLAGRLPRFEEAEPMREALDALADSTPLRSLSARMLLDSGKLALPKKQELANREAWVRERYLRLLGRAPTAEQLADALALLEAPEGRVETLLYALVSSPEYNRS